MSGELDDYKAAFDMYVAQSSEANALWSFQSGVALALLGAAVALTSEKIRLAWWSLLPLLVGYWFFTLANLSALCKAQAILCTLADVANRIAETSQADKLKEVVLRPTPVGELLTGGVVTAHLGFDIVVTSVVIVLSLVARHSTKPKR